ncbi:MULTISPECIES: hypothetical protein [Prevotella]|uniref:Nucleotidyltransferase n=1 Tax=Prevotella herbatica TaxID=2801997 RepID=A0ABM7NW02_9BACT|nr:MULTISPECIES: hypothetical protein [Prevotella]MDN5554684.1 hypothetical protein [Prevotella sp.]BCS84684.1 hypothetical protein prwr041_05770 [Prevotella herbatica]
MKSSISKKELENDALYDTLKAISDCVTGLGLKLYVVGATARDLMMKLLDEYPSKRKTKDLDVAIALSDWSQFENLSKILQKNYFRKDPANQKFYYEGETHDNDYEVDVVPFGDIAGEDETLLWPPEDEKAMSVKCFTEVMNKSMPITINKLFNINIATLAGQFLIKLDAWNDRHTAEYNSKDADDMFLILSKYHDAYINEQNITPPDAVDYINHDNEMIWGAQWLASDIKNILSNKHLIYYASMINAELSKGNESHLITNFIRLYGEDKKEAYDIIINIWSNIYNILNQEIKTKNENK